MEFSTIWLFAIAAATLLIVPGPTVFYIVARSIEQGKKAGLVSVLGVSIGGSVHVLRRCEPLQIVSRESNRKEMNA